jgi:hypothetical protein
MEMPDSKEAIPVSVSQEEAPSSNIDLGLISPADDNCVADKNIDLFEPEACPKKEGGWSW